MLRYGVNYLINPKREFHELKMLFYYLSVVLVKRAIELTSISYYINKAITL